MTSKEKKNRTRTKRSISKASSLQDVADHSGVSTATVSRYLANPKSVREERRQRIERSVAELDYIPHGAAQALASKRSRTIGAIVPTLHNAIFAQGLQFFQTRLQNVGYSLIVATSNYSPDEELTQAETLMSRGVDGMLLVGLSHKERLHERIKSSKIPYVSTWSFKEDYPYPCIGFKNFEAAVRMTTYLLDIGHKNFGVIPGLPENNDRAADRLKGVLSTLKEKGLSIPTGNVIECSYSIQESRQVTKKMLSEDNPPTVIICGNDVIAYGALFECQARGLKVPEDISIIGFDDLQASSQIFPPLTTMQVPFEEMGEKAADYLLACLSNEAVSDHTELEINLIVRGTTAPPK